MTALKWITTEAKKLKKAHPHRFKTWAEYVKQASAIYKSKHKAKKPVSKKHKISGVKKKAKKPSEKSILNKIHKVKRDVEKLDEAQHKHMSIGKIKSAGIGALKHKYGSLAAKRITEKTKRGKNAIAKELRSIASKIKKLHTL
jgi:hypothetical protein